jgi:hypothetical protein
MKNAEIFGRVHESALQARSARTAGAARAARIAASASAACATCAARRRHVRATRRVGRTQLAGLRAIPLFALDQAYSESGRVRWVAQACRDIRRHVGLGTCRDRSCTLSRGRIESRTETDVDIGAVTDLWLAPGCTHRLRKTAQHALTEITLHRAGPVAHGCSSGRFETRGLSHRANRLGECTCFARVRLRSAARTTRASAARTTTARAAAAAAAASAAASCATAARASAAAATTASSCTAASAATAASTTAAVSSGTGTVAARLASSVRTADVCAIASLTVSRAAATRLATLAARTRGARIACSCAGPVSSVHRVRELLRRIAASARARQRAREKQHHVSRTE